MAMHAPSTFAPVITSLLETDLYKLTMLQPMLHAIPTNRAEYRFVCRNRSVFPLTELAPEVDAQLDALCTLRHTDEELTYLGTLRFLKSDFIEFLRLFQFQRRFIQVSTVGETLCITATGAQVHVMGFEIPVLAIVNELYFRRLAAIHGPDTLLGEARQRLQAKIALLRNAATDMDRMRHPFAFFDFGLRRRFSGAWQDEMVATLAAEVPQYFKGTSNVYLAKKYQLTPIGTMAHEYLQTFQAVGVQLKGFQKAALECWVQEYRGDLGVALTDVVGMDAFLADFDLYFAKLFDGLRHDSGDPVANATIHIEPPLIYGENKPPALVCDDSARLVSPTRQVGGALEGFSFDRTTDSAGQVHLTVFTGAVVGEWPLDALEKSTPGTDRVFAGLNVVPAGGNGQLPAELTSLLAAAADNSLADFSGSAQRTALAWLGRLAGPSGALQGVAFAPIYAVDAVGTTNAGVVLFANGPAVRNVRPLGRCSSRQ